MYIWIGLCNRKYICMCLLKYVEIYIFLYTCVFIYIHAYVYMYMDNIHWTCMFIYVYTRMYLYIAIFICVYMYICINLYIIIIIIMSRRLRGYPWPSLAISPYHSSPPAGLQDYNPCPHIAAVCKFVLVVPLLHIHEWGSTGVHRLWARPCFSSSVLRVWFVELV